MIKLKLSLQDYRELSPRRKFKIKLRLIALLLVFAGGYLTAVLIQLCHFWFALFSALLVLLGSFIEFFISDILADKKFPVRTQLLFDALDRKINNVKSSVMEKLKEAIEDLEGCDRGLVSATIHLKVDFYTLIDDKLEEGLVQLTDYYGRSDRGPWRITSCYKGIIGRCLRTGKPEFVNFASEQEYEERMVKEFGFTQTEMQSKSNDARSYFAQPIFSEDQFIGVLYLYSTDYQVFPKAVDGNRIFSTAKDIAMLMKVAKII